MANDSTYKSILKTTSVFGGLQFFQILIGLIKVKIVAVLLGATGMGITNLYTSSIAVLITFSSFGLNSSGVREISELFSQKKNVLLGKSIRIFRILILISAAVGVIFLVVFSSNISKFTFGNINHSFSYLLLTIFVLTSVLAKGNIAILQGTRKIKSIALSSLWGALFGLFVSAPIYYFFELEGIVPALILSGLGTYLISYYYVRKVKFNEETVTSFEFKTIGGKMLALGFAMVFAQLLGQLSIYLTNNYIRIYGSVEDIGFFSAAVGMTSQVVVLLFAAMGSDYYPRLVAVCYDTPKMKKLVNQQGEILLLLAIPILTTFIIFSKIIIKILLTAEFVGIITLVSYISIGMIFKIASFSLGYISFAKNDKRTFMILEGIFSNLLQVSLNIIGYKIGGLNGLGISFILIYIIYFIIISVVSHVKYDFKFSKQYIQIFIPALIAIISSYLITGINSSLYMYFCGLLIIIVSCTFSIYQLDRLIGIISILKNLFYRLAGNKK